MTIRCKAKTQTGKRCKNAAQEGSDFCSVHQPKEQTEVKILRIRSDMLKIPKETILDKHKVIVNPITMDYYALADDSTPKKPYFLSDIIRLKKRTEKVGNKEVVKFKSPYTNTYVRAYKIEFPQDVMGTLREYHALTAQEKQLILI